MRKSIVIFILFLIFNNAMSQNNDDNVKFSLGEYNFKSFYDNSDYSSKLEVNKKGVTLYSNSFPGKIYSIKADEFGSEGKMDILIGVYSGGAHCCFSIFTGHIAENSFIITDSLMLGNSDFEIKDLNDDNHREIFAYDDRFAYAFSSFADSRFSPLIYTILNYKFSNITKNFPTIIDSSINDLKSQMETFIQKGYKCPEREDTYNSDVGTMKAILAPLVLDYYNLGDVNKGYDYINKTYPCKDKDNFIDTLKTVYKLKN